VNLVRLAVVSDVHYAGPAETARGTAIFQPIPPLLRKFVLQYRRWLWMRDQYAHNHLLDRFVNEAAGADLVVANGDYSCDTGHVGLCDDAAFASAELCLGKLRTAFAGRFFAIMGDHELGKKMMAADVGGLRLASYERATAGLGLSPVWRHDVGRYVLLGVTSTLLAFALYTGETLPEETAGWQELIESHRAALHRHLSSLEPDHRVILFCHDPSALPFLAQDELVRARLPLIERTIVGHLHSPLILRTVHCLAGLPPIRFLGHTSRRNSTALREARAWRPFRVQLCPSTSGMQLLKDGGWLSVELDPKGRVPARLRVHRMRWQT